MAKIHVLCCVLLACVAATRGTVDPSNATELRVPDPFDDTLMHHFNVTHTYFRQAFGELGVEYVAPRCRQRTDAAAIRYWLDEYELPRAIRVYDRWEEHREVLNRTRMWHIVLGVVEKVAWEMDLTMRRVGRERYYELLDEKLNGGRGLLPIHIHFRRRPYPQSTFSETVTDVDAVWEVYDEAVYAKYAGRTNDLLYRLRHNMRHSLGLGHIASRQSIMHPTNVPRLFELGPLDVDAVHVLLCDPHAQISERSVVRQPGVVKLARPYHRDNDYREFAFELPKNYFG